MKRVKVVYEGDTADADEMTFTALTPGDHGIIEVGDGSLLSVHRAVQTIYRLCDQKMPNGSPVYLLVCKADVQILRGPSTEAKEPETEPINA